MKKHFSFLVAVLVVVGSLSAQKELEITIDINNKPTDTIFNDQPILFTLHISNTAAQQAFLWNISNTRRIKELQGLLEKNKISQKQFDEEKKILDSSKRSIHRVLIGSIAQPWYNELEWTVIQEKNNEPFKLTPVLLPNPAAEPVLNLDESGYYEIYFGMPANEVSKLPKGTLLISVRNDAFQSNPVSFILTGMKTPVTIANGEEVLLQEGNYYWHSNDGEKVILIAERILSKDPSSIEGLILKGDGHFLQKAYLAALESYNKALKAYYRQVGNNGEPPEYIMAMIAQAKKELGQ